MANIIPVNRRVVLQDVDCCRIIFDFGNRIKESSKKNSEGYTKKPLKSEYILDRGDVYPRNFILKGNRKTKMRKKREETFFIGKFVSCIVSEV
jgi:hypothetical protein